MIKELLWLLEGVLYWLHAAVKRKCTHVFTLSSQSNKRTEQSQRSGFLLMMLFDLGCIWVLLVALASTLFDFVCVSSRAGCGHLCPTAGGRGLSVGRLWENGVGEPPQGQRVHRERGPPPQPGQQQLGREGRSPCFAAVRQPDRTEGGVPAHIQLHNHQWFAGQCELHGFLFRSGQRYHPCRQQYCDPKGTKCHWYESAVNIPKEKEGNVSLL